MSTAISSDSEGMSQPEVATVTKAIKNKNRKKQKRAHKRRREALKQKARAWNTTKGLLCCSELCCEVNFNSMTLGPHDTLGTEGRGLRPR